MIGDNMISTIPRDSRVADFANGRCWLLVATTGGHLAELEEVAKLLRVAPTSLRVTFDNAQSRSMLEELPHEFVPYVAPRDLRGTRLAYREIVRILRRSRFDGVLTTGAAVGLSAMLAGRRFRLPSVYVESLARLRGPSLTGRLVGLLPKVSRISQHRWPKTRGWANEFSVMDAWEPRVRAALAPSKVFVTLGTISPYRFDRLVNRLVEILPAHVEVRWQLGESMVTNLPGARALLDATEFTEALAWADVVVSHAGVGNILSALNAGASTVVVPRRSAFNEHVDDHQLEFAHEMSGRGLMTLRDANDLTWSDLCAATRVVPTRSGL